MLVFSSQKSKELTNSNYQMTLIVIVFIIYLNR